MKCRYFFMACVGDGGEMHASAHPEDICEGNEQTPNSDHCFNAWIDAADTSWALINGVVIAQSYFYDLAAKNHQEVNHQEAWR